MSIRSYQDLTVWKKAMTVAKPVYQLTEKLPHSEIYGLVSQMRRAAVSIPSNIAEGNSRRASKVYKHFLSIAYGSKSELETQFLLCVEIGYLDKQDIVLVMNNLEEISRMLSSMIAKLDE